MVLVLAITLVVQAMASMSTVAIAILMPVAAGEINFPTTYVGYFMSVIYLGAMIISPLSGSLVERYGAICTSQACLLMCAIGLSALSISSLPMMAIGAFILGLGYGPVTPASSHLLVRMSPLSMRSTIFSIKQTGVPLGGALAGAIVPGLVLLHGWERSAIMIGLFNLILASALVMVRKRFDATRSDLVRPTLRKIAEPIKFTMRNSSLRKVVLTSFSFSIMQLCLISFWVTYLIEEIGMSLLQAGVALSIAQTCGVLGRIVWGALSDRFVKPNIMLGLLGIGMTLCSLSLLMVSPQSPKSVVYVIGGLFGSMAIGWNGVFLAEVARIAKPELTGMATGGSLFFHLCRHPDRAAFLFVDRAANRQLPVRVRDLFHHDLCLRPDFTTLAFRRKKIEVIFPPRPCRARRPRRHKPMPPP